MCIDKINISTLLASSKSVHLKWKTPRDEAGRRLKVFMVIVINSRLWRTEVILPPHNAYTLMVPGFRRNTSVEFNLRVQGVYGQEGPVTYAQIRTQSGKIVWLIVIFIKRRILCIG